MPLPQIRRRRTSQQATRRAKRGSREVNQENPIAWCNPANQISPGIQNTRTTLLEANLKPLIEKLRNREQIEPKVRNQSNFSQGKAIRNTNSVNSTYPSFSIAPNTMYSFERIGMRLENHLSFPVIWREQPESMIHLFSKPPACTSVARQRVSKCLNTGVSKV